MVGWVVTADGKINGFSPRRIKVFLTKYKTPEFEVGHSFQTQPYTGMSLNSFLFGGN
jgi:hypothetical protein